MWDAKEGSEQLAVREGGLRCGRSGRADAVSRGAPESGEPWGVGCAGRTLSLSSRQAGRQKDRDFIELLQYLGIQGNSVKPMKWSPSELPAVFLHCCYKTKGRSHVIIP